MRTKDFPFCCAAKIIYNFPYDNSWYTKEEQKKQQDKFKKELETKIDLFKKQNKSIIVAIVNSRQKQSKHTLQSLGFKRSAWLSRPSGATDKISLLALSLGDESETP